MEQVQIDGLSGRRDGFPEGILHVGSRGSGRMTTVQIQSAVVGDEVRLDPSADPAHVHRDAALCVLWAHVAREVGQHTRHPMNRIVAEVRSAAMGAASACRGPVPQHALLRNDNPQC